ncbi:hypothetical protein D3C71_1631210 [compost metagenome]
MGKQGIDGLLHRLLFADTIYPEPVSVGVVRPVGNHTVIRCLLGRGGKVSGHVEVVTFRMLEQFRPVVPTDLFILHQTFFTGGNP